MNSTMSPIHANANRVLKVKNVGRQVQEASPSMNGFQLAKNPDANRRREDWSNCKEPEREMECEHEQRERGVGPREEPPTSPHATTTTMSITAT